MWALQLLALVLLSAHARSHPSGLLQDLPKLRRLLLDYPPSDRSKKLHHLDHNPQSDSHKNLAKGHKEPPEDLVYKNVYKNPSKDSYTVHGSDQFPIDVNSFSEASRIVPYIRSDEDHSHHLASVHQPVHSDDILQLNKDDVAPATDVPKHVGDTEDLNSSFENHEHHSHERIHLEELTFSRNHQNAGEGENLNSDDVINLKLIQPHEDTEYDISKEEKIKSSVHHHPKSVDLKHAEKQSHLLDPHITLENVNHLKKLKHTSPEDILINSEGSLWSSGTPMQLETKNGHIFTFKDKNKPNKSAYEERNHNAAANSIYDLQNLAEEERPTYDVSDLSEDEKSIYDSRQFSQETKPNYQAHLLSENGNSKYKEPNVAAEEESSSNEARYSGIHNSRGKITRPTKRSHMWQHHKNKRPKRLRSSFKYYPEFARHLSQIIRQFLHAQKTPEEHDLKRERLVHDGKSVEIFPLHPASRNQNGKAPMALILGGSKRDKGRKKYFYSKKHKNGHVKASVEILDSDSDEKSEKDTENDKIDKIVTSATENIDKAIYDNDKVVNPVAELGYKLRNEPIVEFYNERNIAIRSEKDENVSDSVVNDDDDDDSDNEYDDDDDDDDYDDDDDAVDGDNDDVDENDYFKDNVTAKKYDTYESTDKALKPNNKDLLIDDNQKNIIFGPDIGENVLHHDDDDNHDDETEFYDFAYESKEKVIRPENDRDSETEIDYYTNKNREKVFKSNMNDLSTENIQENTAVGLENDASNIQIGIDKDDDYDPQIDGYYTDSSLEHVLQSNEDDFLAKEDKNVRQESVNISTGGDADVSTDDSGIASLSEQNDELNKIYDTVEESDHSSDYITEENSGTEDISDDIKRFKLISGEENDKRVQILQFGNEEKNSNPDIDDLNQFYSKNVIGDDFINDRSSDLKISDRNLVIPTLTQYTHEEILKNDHLELDKNPNRNNTKDLIVETSEELEPEAENDDNELRKYVLQFLIPVNKKPRGGKNIKAKIEYLRGCSRERRNLKKDQASQKAYNLSFLFNK